MSSLGSWVWVELLYWGVAAGLRFCSLDCLGVRRAYSHISLLLPPRWSKGTFLCFLAHFAPSVGLKAQRGCASVPCVHAQGQHCLQASVTAGSGSHSRAGPGWACHWRMNTLELLASSPGWVGSARNCLGPPQSLCSWGGGGRVATARGWGWHRQKRWRLTCYPGSTSASAPPKCHPLRDQGHFLIPSSMCLPPSLEPAPSFSPSGQAVLPPRPDNQILFCLVTHLLLITPVLRSLTTPVLWRAGEGLRSSKACLWRCKAAPSWVARSSLLGTSCFAALPHRRLELSLCFSAEWSGSSSLNLRF